MFANAKNNSVENEIWEKVIRKNPRSRVAKANTIFAELLRNPKAVGHFTQTIMLNYLKSHTEEACKFEHVALEQVVALSMGITKSFR